MTNSQMRSLGRYVSDIAQMLGLDDWKITVHAEEPGDAIDGSDAIASVSCTYGRKIASLRLGKDFLNSPPEEQRHVLVHELIHVHMWGVLALVRTTLPKMLGESAYDVLLTALTQQDEHATDALATAVAPMLPLWGGK